MKQEQKTFGMLTSLRVGLSIGFLVFFVFFWEYHLALRHHLKHP